MYRPVSGVDGRALIGLISDWIADAGESGVSTRVMVVLSQLLKIEVLTRTRSSCGKRVKMLLKNWMLDCLAFSNRSTGYTIPPRLFSTILEELSISSEISAKPSSHTGVGVGPVGTLKVTAQVFESSTAALGTDVGAVGASGLRKNSW